MLPDRAEMAQWAAEMGSQECHKAQQGEVQSLAAGEEQPQAPVRSEGLVVLLGTKFTVNQQCVLAAMYPSLQVACRLGLGVGVCNSGLASLGSIVSTASSSGLSGTRKTDCENPGTVYENDEGTEASHQ